VARPAATARAARPATAATYARRGRHRRRRSRQPWSPPPQPAPAAVFQHMLPPPNPHAALNHTNARPGRAAPGSGRDDAGSGGPHLRRRREAAPARGTPGSGRPRPSEATGEEGETPRRRHPRGPHEQPVARSGSGAAGGSKTLAAAARVEASPGRPRGGRRERAARVGDHARRACVLLNFGGGTMIWNSGLSS
jgi:hypothetical protein